MNKMHNLNAMYVREIRLQHRQKLIPQKKNSEKRIMRSMEAMENNVCLEAIKQNPNSELHQQNEQKLENQKLLEDVQQRIIQNSLKGDQLQKIQFLEMYYCMDPHKLTILAQIRRTFEK